MTNPRISSPPVYPIWWIIRPSWQVLEEWAKAGLSGSTCYVLHRLWIDAIHIGAAELGLLPEQVTWILEETHDKNASECRLRNVAAE